MLVLKPLLVVFVGGMILKFLFFLLSSSKFHSVSSRSSFECGFESFNFSRSSFSIQFFLIGLIFLYLDLELSFLMMFFLEHSMSLWFTFKMSMFILFVLLGLFFEWFFGMFEWLS